MLEMQLLITVIQVAAVRKLALRHSQAIWKNQKESDSMAAGDAVLGL